MSHSFGCRALVMKTYDTGEADRFCILLTRERGRVTATATGVRKLTSRLGGFLLPFHHLSLQLREGKSGMYVAGAERADPPLDAVSDMAAFMQAQEGVELLLAFVSHEEPDEHVFDAAVQFLSSCAQPSPAALVVFHLRLLHLLGLLPEDENIETILSLSDVERSFVEAARYGRDVPSLPHSSLMRARELCLRCSADHLRGPLKATEVAGRL